MPDQPQIPTRNLSNTPQRGSTPDAGTTSRTACQIQPHGHQSQPAGAGSQAGISSKIAKLLRSNLRPSNALEVKRKAEHFLSMNCDPEWISGAVVATLAHFWRNDDPPQLRRSIVKDYLTALSGLPQWAVEKARVEIVKTARRRPPPALWREKTLAEMHALGRLRARAHDMAEEAKPRPERSPDERTAIVLEMAKHNPLLKKVIR